MQNFKLLLPFVLLVGLFAACSKDSFFTNNPSVNTAFAGRVVDENGQAISGVQVRVGGDLSTTDANGVFRLDAQRVPSDNAILMVSKIGYFEFSRALYVSGDALQTLNIQLLRKEQSGSLNAAIGGTVTMPGGASLVFPAGAFVDQRGNAYNGMVRVFARKLEHSATLFAWSMPGDLRGINLAGDEQTLGNYGMLGVELQGQAGQALHIRPDNEVEIQLPISPAQLTKAPSEISLWHFDVQEARWKEEGRAKRNGSMYVGRVKHFSFWSFSTAFNLVLLEGRVFLIDDQHPLAGAVVRLTMTSDSSMAFATTKSNGHFKGAVPLGEIFIMDVLDECGEVLFTQNIGPFDLNTALPNVIVPNFGTNNVSITGRLIDCTGVPIKNGYAQVLIGNFKWVAFTAPDGSFILNKTHCDTSVATGTLVGYDLQNLLQSATDTISVPPNTIAADDIIVCDGLDEYIRFSLDYNDFVIAAPVGGVLDNGGMRTFLNGYSSAQQDVGISMEFASSGQTGTFPLSKLYVNTLTWNTGVSNVSIEVLEPGYVVGDYMVGSFEGTFTDQFGVKHELTGSYQVRRDY